MWSRPGIVGAPAGNIEIFQDPVGSLDLEQLFRPGADLDRAGRNLRAETSEKQAAKVRQSERRIERLEVVEEPRKEWQLRMTIAAAPRAGAVVATLRAAVIAGSASGRSGKIGA